MSSADVEKVLDAYVIDCPYCNQRHGRRYLCDALSAALEEAERERDQLAERYGAEMDRCVAAESALASAREGLDGWKPVVAFNEALWVNDTQGHVDQLGICKNDTKQHFRRPECRDWQGLYLASLPAPSQPEPRACACCMAPADNHPTPDPWDGRLDDYCNACALARCDAYLGGHHPLDAPQPDMQPCETHVRTGEPCTIHGTKCPAPPSPTEEGS